MQLYATLFSILDQYGRVQNWRYIYIYITNLVCYTYFHWFFNPECQHNIRKTDEVYISVPKNDKNMDDKTLASLNQCHNTE